MAEASLEQVVSVVLELRDANGGDLNKVTRPAVVQKLGLQGLTLKIEDYGNARNYVKGLPPKNAPVVNKSLDSPLIELFIKGSKSFPPMRRWDPTLRIKIEDAAPGANWIVQEQMLTRLMTVLCHVEVQQKLDTCLAVGKTVREFVKLGPDGQIKLINDLWEQCTVKKAYDTNQAAMTDNVNPVNEKGAQLPSSIHPVRSGARITTFKLGRGGMPFRELGVGFRAEGSGSEERIKWHIDRVVGDGMRPQVTLEKLMLDNGYNVSGTCVSTGTLAPRINVTQKDLWNESGICVARSFLGATAFPYRWTKDRVIVWALNVAGLVGFDTEQYQLDNKVGNGPWRPGEKCFGRIEADRILGYVVIKKLGNDGGGWSFATPLDAKWGPTAGKASKAQQTYIEEELEAWRDASVDVGTGYDFAQLV